MPDQEVPDLGGKRQVSLVGLLGELLFSESSLELPSRDGSTLTSLESSLRLLRGLGLDNGRRCAHHEKLTVSSRDLVVVNGQANQGRSAAL